MKNLRLLFMILALASCAPKTVSTKTDTPATQNGDSVQTALRDGTSMEKAVIVKDIPSEYKWVKEHYPGSRVLGQALLGKNGKTMIDSMSSLQVVRRRRCTLILIPSLENFKQSFI